jgi:arylsulfatase A-like enzyme
MFEADGPRADDVEAQLALYDGELAYLDSLLGQLLSVVDEETIVVVTSDHGESFEHGYLYNHRESLWDNTLRVPLVIRGSGISAGSTHSQQVALTDILPTILTLAGLPNDRKIQGSSLLDGHEQPRVYSTTDPWFGDRQVSARTQVAKGIWRDGLSPLGYDLSTDPNENNDLGAIPETLIGADSDYASIISSGSSLQRPELPSRHISPQRAEQLEALGYVGER